MAYKPVPEKEDHSIILNQALYFGALGAFVLLALAAVLLRSYTGGWLTKFGIYNADFVTILLAAHFVCSWRGVSAGYIAGITIFNVPVLEVSSGFYWMPLGISELLLVPVSTQNEQFPGDPEKISKAPDDQGLLPGQVRPIRIMTGEPEEDEDDILNERMMLEFLFSVRWRISDQARDLGVFEFLLRLPGTTWSEKLRWVSINMRDTGEGLLNKEVSVRSTGRVFKEIGPIGEALKTSIQEAFARTDILIEEVLLQSPDPGYTVAKALSLVPAARAEAKSRIITAQSTGSSTRIAAEAEYDARVALSKARARELAVEGEGMRDAAEALGVSGAEYLALQQAPKILGDKTIIIGGDGIAQALALAPNLVKTLGNQDKKKE